MASRDGVSTRVWSVILGVCCTFGALLTTWGAVVCLANALVYPHLPLDRFEYIEGTLQYADYRSSRRACYLGLRVEGADRSLNYRCGRPGFDRLLRATRARGVPVQIWHEPTWLHPAGGAVDIWQARVNGQIVLSHEEIAGHFHWNIVAIGFPIVMFVLVGIPMYTVGVGLLLSMLGVGSDTAAERRSRTRARG